MALATPRIDALLTRLRGALRRQVWLHGLGTVAAVAAGWLLFAYLADRFLHVPGPIRIVHALVGLGLPLVLLWREFARPLAKVPDREGLAVLAGRAAPHTHDLIVSAVQLAPQTQEREGGQALVARVVAEAEEASGTVDVREVLEPEGPRRRAWIGLGAVLLCGLALAAQPAMTRIFFARALGASVPWPRRTTLLVEVPIAGDRAQVTVDGDEILVRAARGSDVPVLVRAEGEVPSEVVLRFDGGFESVLASGGTALFRTSLRGVQEDQSFSVVGGDDNDGLPRVRLEVLQPPDVGGLAFSVTPPSYTGLPPELSFGTSVQALEGSAIRVHVLPDPVDSVGQARLYPSDQTLPLEAVPFPQDPSLEPRPEPTDSLTSLGLAFDLVASGSLRFSVELVDASGLPNPDPGLFAVQVTPDRKPELTMLSPARTELDVVAGGAVPLRVRVGDDFGLAGMSWDVRPVDDPERQLAGGELELLAYTPADPAAERSRLRDERIASGQLEVTELDPGEPLAEGRILVLQVMAADLREPEPGEAQSAPIRLRVVSADEYLRRLKENLARVGDRAATLFQLGTELSDQLRDLSNSYAEASGDSEFGDPDELSYGARRLSGDTRTLGRDLAALTEGLVYSRLDPRSGAILQSIGAALAQDAERTFRPEPWLAIADDYAAGKLGRADLGGDLVELVGLALGVSERHIPAVATALSAASSADSPQAEQAAVGEALEAARLAQADLEVLLTRLGEWDDIQSVMSFTLDILNRQKNLLQRTKSYAEDQ